MFWQLGSLSYTSPGSKVLTLFSRRHLLIPMVQPLTQALENYGHGHGLLVISEIPTALKGKEIVHDMEDLLEEANLPKDMEWLEINRS